MRNETVLHLKTKENEQERQSADKNPTSDDKEKYTHNHAPCSNLPLCMEPETFWQQSH